MKELRKARLALATVCLLWGTTYFAIHIAVSDLPPALFCSVRFALAGGLLMAYCLLRGDALPRGRAWGDCVLVGLLLMGAGNGVLAWALQRVPTGIASLIVVTTPFWLVIFARLGGERIKPRAAAGLLTGFLGMALLLGPRLGGSERAPGFLEGAVAVVVSTLSWSWGSVHSKRTSSSVSSLLATSLHMLFGSAALAAAGLWRGEAALWHPTPRSLLAMAYLVAFGSIVGYASYIYALSKLPTSQVAVYAYVNPVIAVLLGTLFLDEPLDAVAIAGIALVLAGVRLVHSAGVDEEEPSAAP